MPRGEQHAKRLSLRAGTLYQDSELRLTVGGRLPHLDGGVGQGRARLDVGDLAVHVHDLRVGGRVEADGAAVLAQRRVVPPKGPQDGRRRQALCALGRRAEGDVVDQPARLTASARALSSYGPHSKPSTHVPMRGC